MSRRGVTDLCGIILVDKPAGMTSHDVVAAVRRATGEGRVGHAGTLDPMATGLLVVLVGPATRLATYLTAASKRYEARIVFGAATDTDDAEGTVTHRAAVPADVADPDFAAGKVAELMGERLQTPPAVSAIKLGGITAYRAARAGKRLKLDPRQITVTDARLCAVNVEEPEPLESDAAVPEPVVSWDIDVRVSKGTYVRALARDLGDALGTAAHLGALRRTEAGVLSVADAHSLIEVGDAETPDEIRALFADMLVALDLPVVEIPAEHLPRARVGARLPIEGMGLQSTAEDALVALSSAGSLIGVFQRKDNALVPRTVMAEVGS